MKVIIRSLTVVFLLKAQGAHPHVEILYSRKFSWGKIFMDLSKIRCEPYRLFDFHVAKHEIHKNFAHEIMSRNQWSCMQNVETAHTIIPQYISVQWRIVQFLL